MKCLIPLFALALLFACSAEQPATTTTEAAATPQAPPPPSPDTARTLIAESPAFGEFEFTNAAYTLPTDGSLANENTRAVAKDLADAGWISVARNGDLTLTAKAESDRRFLLRPNGTLDIVPLAKKEMGDVTAVRQNADGTVAADFTWRWVPNEIGSTLQAGFLQERFAGTQRGTATLMWDGSSWSVLSIVRH